MMDCQRFIGLEQLLSYYNEFRDERKRRAGS
jgi:hypothetical protein